MKLTNDLRSARSRLHRSTFIAMGWMLFIMIIAAAVSLMLGEQNIALFEAVRALFGYGEAEFVMIVQTLRAPRMIVGWLIGAALAVSGAILQGVVRNPLAAPDVVGITGGASVGAVAYITYMTGLYSIHWLPLAAILGAFIAAGLIYAIAWRRGVSPLRLILVGVGISSLLSALTSFMLLMSPAYSATSAYIWLTGTVYGSSWPEVWTLVVWLAVCTAVLCCLMKPMNIQLLTDETAIGLGNQVQKNRLILVALSVCLAGVAVSIGGVIGFIGLLAPHAARRMTGPIYSRLLPVSAFIGGNIVMIADLAARTIYPPYDIPVGVFTSGVGAPFFIYLLYRTKRI